MGYEFEIKTIDPVDVVSIQFQGSYEDMGKHMGTLYKELKGKADGAPFACYYNGQEDFNAPSELELCIPCRGTVTSNRVTVKQLSGGKALCTTHVGSYSRLGEAYDAILSYAKEKGYEISVPSREVYVKGPGAVLKGNPDKYITEIQIPIA